MGDWRRVFIDGTCAENEVEALKAAFTPKEDYSDWGPLCISEGMAGLGDWVAARIHRIGNLSERDYSPEDVAEHLRERIGVAPSLTLKIHCGNNWEKSDCVVTITVEDGKVIVGEAEIDILPEIPDEQVEANLYRQLYGLPKFGEYKKEGGI